MKARLGFALLLLSVLPLAGQTPATTSADPFQALHFLEGTWDAQVQNNPKVATSGRYVFQRELGGHILARHATTDPACKAPADFDCAHGDLLYVYEDVPGHSLRAIYFDNEGHVIHYDVTSPTPTSVTLLSDANGPGPQFRLSYELKSGVMTGRFQMRMPGKSDWITYLEWSGHHL